MVLAADVYRLKTQGRILPEKDSRGRSKSVAVRWHRKEGDKLMDWFQMSELKFLEVVE